ncbi:hypothetical protein L3Q82_009172 [Scortum barcoo]|uniref:Uncharacterized protein n=1 Tax=Scortum barcoo TaxID=214431 RepID=A0ACB8XBZ6_9TELE|nr:hypothetical protein L3Q82_009172 [Scortum barcoo]
MDSRILCSFYRCTIESILTGCITAWNLYTQQCRKKATEIIKDPSHPSHRLFCLLPVIWPTVMQHSSPNHQAQGQLHTCRP